MQRKRLYRTVADRYLVQYFIGLGILGHLPRIKGAILYGLGVYVAANTPCLRYGWRETANGKGFDLGSPQAHAEFVWT